MLKGMGKFKVNASKYNVILSAMFGISPSTSQSMQNKVYQALVRAAYIMYMQIYSE